MPLTINPVTGRLDWVNAVSVETDPVFVASEAAGFAVGDAAKLAGIEAGAEVNNISDINATDLTDGGATTLHSHAGGGDISGTVTVGQLVEGVTDTKTIQAANLIAPANLLTLVAGGAYSLTIPATGTVALLGTANAFTAAQTINVNSATAFVVEQDGVKDNTLVVDTTNGGIGINTATTAADTLRITSAGAAGPSIILEDGTVATIYGSLNYNAVNANYASFTIRPTQNNNPYISIISTANTNIGFIMETNKGSTDLITFGASKCNILDIRNHQPYAGGTGNITISPGISGSNVTVLTLSSITQNALIQTSGVGIIGLTIKATASQTANMVEIQGSDAAVHNSFQVPHATNVYANIFNEQGSPNLDFRVESDAYDALFIDASNDSIMLMSNAAGKVGFYGVAAVAQQVLATGAGATVDNVISFLQTVGLCKQA